MAVPKEDKIKLSDKQKAFCHYYIIDWNATKAAILSGYSENSARQIATETLSKPYIQAYIKEIQDDIAKEAGISMLSQVLELKKIAYTNIAEMFTDWVDLESFDKLTLEQKAAITEIAYKKDIKHINDDTDIETEYVKLKLHDKIRAIQEINKMLGYAVDKVDLTTKGKEITNTTIIVESQGLRDGIETELNRLKENAT
jgi:phage terminase small subunit